MADARDAVATLDLSECAREPIHVPGAIQPHGAVLAVASDGRVSHASANGAALFGRAPGDCLGRPLGEIIHSALAARALAVPAVAAMHIGAPLHRGAIGGDGAHRALLSVHRHAGHVVVEAEPDDAPDADEAVSTGWAYALRQTLWTGTSIEAIGRMLSTALRDLSGFDNVMIYRFDRQWNGTVIGEARAADVPSYLDLSFPASDIPEQARELYRRQVLRVIPDVAYAAVPLLARDGAQPLDMSFAALRAVSPVHLEYLRNMGVRATLVCSVLVRQSLWGLIVGHHYAGPRRPPTGVRQSFGMATLLLGEAIERLDDAAELAAIRRVHGLCNALAAVPHDRPLATAIAEASPAFEDLFGLSGLFGHVNGLPVVAGAVAGRPRPVPLDGPTLRLTQRFEPDEANRLGIDAGITGGAVLPFAGDGYLVLGRPERAVSITWSGDPGQPALQLSDDGQLHPRRSFARYVQEIAGSAIEFNRVEQAALEALHHRLDVLVGSERERQMQARVREAERLSAIGRVAGSVAHDLNNLLHVVQLNLELLEDLDLGDEGAGNLGVALDALRSGTEITSSLLAFARRNALLPERIGIRDILGKFRLMALPILGDVCRLQVTVEGAVGAITTDVAQLQTALLNLVINARDALGAEGGTIRVRARAVTRPADAATALSPGRYVAIAVSDDGPGMPDAVKTRAFEPFFTTKAPGSGTGLGLSTVYGFAQQSGGTVELRSAPGRGTEIMLMLPLDQASAPARARPEAVADCGLLDGLTILIVDDRLELAATIARHCRRWGMMPEIATSLDEAVRAITTQRFDVCLSDVMLGKGTTGYDVAACARRQEPPVPMLLMSGFNELPEKAADRADPAPILWKPFPMQKLADALAALLRPDHARHG